MNKINEDYKQRAGLFLAGYVSSNVLFGWAIGQINLIVGSVIIGLVFAFNKEIIKGVSEYAKKQAERNKPKGNDQPQDSG